MNGLKDVIDLLGVIYNDPLYVLGKEAEGFMKTLYSRL